MPLTLTIGDQNGTQDLNIAQLTDLSLLVTKNGAAGTSFKLATVAINPALPQISDFPLLDKDISLTYASNPQKWNLDGGAFTFGISGGVAGTLHIYSPGKLLFAYTPSLPALNGFDPLTAAKTAQFVVPAGKYCVGIALQLTLDVNAGGSGTIGSVGIKGTADFNGTYNFSFFKMVDANATTSNALIAAFSSFTLPLNNGTFAKLLPGDAILHNFKADLKLGLGLTFGFQTPQIARSIRAPLLDATEGLPSLTAKANPSAALSLSPTVSFEYTGSFEAYIWKESDTVGHYHLYRTTKLDTTFGIDAKANLITNASVTVDGGNLTQAIKTSIAGGTGQTIAQVITQNTAIQAGLDQAAKDTNTAITNLLKPIQSGTTELQASIEITNTNTLLLNLTIDLTPAQTGFGLAAWLHISTGDFVAALQQQHNGITVDAGSGLEQLHHRKTDLKFTFFNFTGEWSTTHINDYSIVYGGNSSISFINTAGLETITNINKSGKEIQFYFTTAVNTDANGILSIQDPDLHVTLKSINNSNFGLQIARFLFLIAGGSAPTTAYNQMKSIASNGNATIELDLVFKPTAYQRLQSSPHPLQRVAQEDLDKTNFGAFASVVWNFNDRVANIADFSYQKKLDLTYDVWAVANNYLNFGPLPGDFQIPDPRLPDRRLLLQPAPSTQAGLEPALNPDGISTDDLISIVFTLNVGASFMNLCQDLQGIGADPAASAQTAFNNLKSEVAAILSKDVDGSYLVPIACTLAELVEAEEAQITYTAPALPSSQDPGYTLIVELT